MITIPIINVNGKNIYYEAHGSKENPPLLFLHGGPGSSCIDFCLYQANALSSNLYVIAFDQRGVCRSEEIRDDEEFGINNIIYDCEEMRIAMGIPSWSLLGHSFGGSLAVRYAAMFPNSIYKVIYESPSFDVYYSFKSNFNLLYEYYCKNGNTVRAEYCLSSLKSPSGAKEITDRFMKIPNGIGQQALDYLFFHSIKREEVVKNFVYPQVTEEMNQKSIKAAFRVMEDETFYQSNLELLDKIQAPSLLIAGKYDGVCDEYQRHYFETHSPQGKVIMFENSAHFVSFDEPEKYTQEVLGFILQ